MKLDTNRDRAILWYFFNGGGGASYSGDAPNPDELVYHLDGTISGSELVDIKNGYNFTINNKDFDSDTYGGVPFKSIATISPPSSGAAKTAVLAIDVNNFWYDSGGSPNSIPITSFFQNIDFNNTLFCKHTDRVVDANSEETTPPLVTDICGYSAAQTIDSTMTDYFGTKIDRTTITKALWVSKSGNDTTGDGSFLNPYLTIDKCEPLLDDGSVYNKIYVSTGEYTEDSGGKGYLYIRESTGMEFTLVGTGYNVLKSTSSILLETFNCVANIEGFVFDGESARSTGIYSTTGYAVNVERCLVKNITTNSINCPITNSIINSVVLDGNITKARTITGSYIKEISTSATDDINFTYNKFVDSVTTLLKITNNTQTSCNINVDYNYFNNNDICLDLRLDAATSCSVQRNKFYSSAGGTAFRAIATAGGGAIISGDTCTPYINYNYIQSDHNTTALIDVNGQAFNDPEVMYNVFVENGGTTSTFRAINFSTDLNSGVFKANYNRIFINTAQEGYGIVSGETGGDFFTGSEIVGNYIRGHLYNYPEETSGGLHGIAASRGTDMKVAYNRVEYVPLGIVVKGGSTAYTTEGVYSNVVYECEAGFYLRQCNGLKLYNNTFANGSVRTKRFGAFDSEDGNTLLDITFTNNIFKASDDVIILFSIEKAALDNDRVLFDDNIFDYPESENDFIVDFEAIPNIYTYADSVTNGWVLNGEEATPVFNNLATGELWLQTGSPGLVDGTTLAAAYDDGLDITTDWNNDETDTDVDNYPTIVTKQQTVPWDKGAYVISGAGATVYMLDSEGNRVKDSDGNDIVLPH